MFGKHCRLRRTVYAFRWFELYSLPSLWIAATTSIAAAQTKGMLPYDHIHLNEPAAEASVWWEKNIPGGRRITEAPDRIMYGAVRMMFLGARSSGGSQGSVIEHLGFSVADLDAKMRELACD